MSVTAQPQVSVVVKSYNHADFVGETIRSILDQSFQDFEIVVTDDGSTDGTPDVVRSFSDPRIRLEVFPHNRGISHAMNDAIARARGEYVAILNSDDFALPGRLERQTAFLRANPNIGAVFTLPRTVDDRGVPVASFFDFALPFSLPDFSRRSWLKYFFFHRNCLCAPTAMVRRSVYRQIGSYDARLINLQDLDMWIRVCAGHDIHVMREELTAFRIRGDDRNMSAPRPDTKLRAEFEFSRILRNYRAMGPDLIRAVFAEDFAAAGISLLGSHDHWLAELALHAGSPAHRLFALETLFETAQSDVDLRRLREVAGGLEIFGLLAADEHRRHAAQAAGAIAELRARVQQLEEALQGREAELAAARGAAAAQETEMAALRDAITSRETERQSLRRAMDELLSSRSWRYTAALRRLSHMLSKRK
jgi:glycosyltransferase involved in cell wall biosynthesis